MCVFDPIVRYAEPRRRSWDDEEKIDPLDLYGLDDDPPRPPKEVSGQQSIPGFNPLNWKLGDATFPEWTSLTGWHSQRASPLPERLHHIARWFAEVMHEPSAIWWAAGWKTLNPSMLKFISRRLARYEADLSQDAASFWRIFLENCDHGGNADHEYGWFEFCSMVSKTGWSNAALRSFERLSQPEIEFSRASYGHYLPGEESWDDLPLWQLVDAKVRVLDRHNTKLDIPGEQLAGIVALVRRSLVIASSLLDEVGTLWWDAPTLHPTGEHGESFHGRKTLHLLWFRDLFVSLVGLDPEAASLEVKQWPINDKYFFGKLSIFAAMYGELMSGKQTAKLLLELNDHIFWEPRCQRELLLTLRERWSDLTSKQRRAIERRIEKGPPKWEEEKISDFRRRKAVYAAERLAWFEWSGCKLSPAAGSQLTKLKGADPNWSDEWARNADRSHDSRGGFVERVTDTRGIESLPIGKILDEAKKKTESPHGELRDYRPFDGLVESRPFRALSALRFAQRNGEFPTKFWDALLSRWPDETPLKLRWLTADTVARLPANTLEALKYSAPRWLKKHLGALVESDRERALAIFDRVAQVYVSAAPGVTKSGIGNTTIGGVVQRRSEVSFDKAINSPLGVLVEALWTLMPKSANENGPMPDGVGERLELLFTANGDGAGHAACVVARHFSWLDHWFSEWSDRALRPLFEVDHPLSEAVWHGHAASHGWPSLDTRRILSPSLLAVLKGQVAWVLDDSCRRYWIQKMVVLTRPENEGGPLISFRQAREVLLAVDDKGRADALWMLGSILSKSGAWTSFVKPFIEQAWPRQVKFRTELVSRSFAHLIEKSGDNFPDAVRTIVSLLKPVAHLDMITYRLSKDAEEGAGDFAQRFPAETLQLLNSLVANDKSQVPYELGKALEVIAEADPKLRQTKEWRRLINLVD